MLILTSNIYAGALKSDKYEGTITHNPTAKQAEIIAFKKKDATAKPVSATVKYNSAYAKSVANKVFNNRYMKGGSQIVVGSVASYLIFKGFQWIEGKLVDTRASDVQSVIYANVDFYIANSSTGTRRCVSSNPSETATCGLPANSEYWTYELGSVNWQSLNITTTGYFVQIPYTAKSKVNGNVQNNTMTIYYSLKDKQGSTAPTVNTNYVYVTPETIKRAIEEDADKPEFPWDQVLDDPLATPDIDRLLDNALSGSSKITPETDPVTGDTNYKLSPACEWFTVVCDFIDWVQQKDTDDIEEEIETPVPETSDTSFNFNGHCPTAPKVSFNYFGTTFNYEFSYLQLCSLAQNLKPFIIFMATIWSVYIIAGISRGEE